MRFSCYVLAETNWMYFISVAAKGPEKEEVLKKEEVLPQPV